MHLSYAPLGTNNGSTRLILVGEEHGGGLGSEGFCVIKIFANDAECLNWRLASQNRPELCRIAALVSKTINVPKNMSRRLG